MNLGFYICHLRPNIIIPGKIAKFISIDRSANPVKYLLWQFFAFRISILDCLDHFRKS